MKTEQDEFDFGSFEKAALKQLGEGKPLEGKDGVLTPLIKRLVEASFEGELDAHLATEQGSNRRNGKTSKKVKTSLGTIDIVTPRERNGNFEPELLPKRSTTLGATLNHKIISLYGIGMSYKDICKHIEEMYGVSTSPASLSAITDRVIADVKAWQRRPLESVYPFMWLDAIHFKVKENGGIRSKAIYSVLAVNREGIKELLGLYIGENEGARFWLSVMSDLQNRGVKDIIIACTDNLSGIDKAIQSVFPETINQLCIVHQIRASLKYIPIKQRKTVMDSLKLVYKAPNKDQAEVGLKQLEETWGAKYPAMVKSWLNNWERLSQYFDYPEHIRRIIYTNNIIESVHSQFRKVTKTKRVFSSDMSLLKLLYLVQENLAKKWSQPISGWKQTMSQMVIIFEQRMNKP